MIEKRKREELYDKFRQGAVPSGADFADLIRSQLNLLDDGIDISEDPEDPICLKAHGMKENLLDFSDQENRRRWRISGRCEDESKEGFNIKADENSKLYIERESGNVGLSTDQPAAKLHIIQTSATDALRIDDEGNDGTPLIVTSDGQVGIGLENPGAKLHVSYSGSGDILRVDDNEDDTTPFMITEAGDVGIGYGDPKAKLTVSGGVSIGQNYNPGNNNLYVEGNVEVAGSVVFSGGSGVGGIEINAPLTSKTTEIIIKDNLKIMGDPEQPGSDGNLSVAGDTTLGIFNKVYESQSVVTVNGRIRSGTDLQNLEEQYELEINDILTVDRNPQTRMVTVEGDLTVIGATTLGNNQGDDYIYLNGLVKREDDNDVTIDDNLTVTKNTNLNNLSVGTRATLHEAVVNNDLTVSKTANLSDAVLKNNLTVNKTSTLNEVNVLKNLRVGGNSNLNEAVIKNLTLQSGATANNITTDHTLGGNSNLSIPTERAVKRYVDDRVAGIKIVYA